MPSEIRGGGGSGGGGGGSGALTLIKTYNSAALLGLSHVTFTGLPASGAASLLLTGTLVCSGLGTGSVAAQLTFNGDSSASYNTQRFYAENSFVAAAPNYAADYYYLCDVPDITTSIPSVFTATIMDPGNASLSLGILSEYFFKQYEAGYFSFKNAGQYYTLGGNPGTAITSLDVALSSPGLFAAPSRLSLYSVAQ